MPRFNGCVANENDMLVRGYRQHFYKCHSSEQLISANVQYRILKASTECSSQTLQYYLDHCSRLKCFPETQNDKIL